MGEGKVANFLLATTGIITLRYAFMKKKMLLDVSIALLKGLTGLDAFPIFSLPFPVDVNWYEIKLRNYFLVC